MRAIRRLMLALSVITCAMPVLSGCGIGLSLLQPLGRDYIAPPEARDSIVPPETLGPAFTKAKPRGDNTAIVYLYRPASFFYRHLAYKVTANGLVVRRLYNGGYYPYVAETGRVEFSATMENTSTVTLDVKPGEVYFIRGTVGMGLWVGRASLAIVPPAVGETEIRETKRIP